MEHHSVGVVSLGEFIRIEFGQLGAELVGRGEAVGAGVFVAEVIDIHFFYRCYADVTRAGNIAALSGLHHAVLPEPNGLGFVALADGWQKFFLEEQHFLVFPGGRVF